MAGNGVYNHFPLQAGFNVFVGKLRYRHTEVFRYPHIFFGGNVNHQTLATVAAFGAINLRGNFCIQLMHHCINLRADLPLQKLPELIVFRLFFSAFFFYNLQLVGKFHRAKVVDSWEFGVDSWGALRGLLPFAHHHSDSGHRGGVRCNPG